MSKTNCNQPRRVGVFGGTFNPIHLGHQNLMKNALLELELDELLLIPTYIPPHKVADDLATG
ncbi:MAG: adenylyltransferase/cytidyltransferase family protein, partial [Oscillospiraceae bacterium]|nr:adenylyltransferase/cytidyltransferase family protein [Oscillospiraceae bacterium]